MSLKYEAELKNKIVEYQRVVEQIEDMTKEKEKLRDQFKEWMLVNGLEEHYALDPNNQYWKIGKQVSNRKKVSDWALLRHLIGKDYNEVVTESASESFIVKKVKAPK